MSISQLTTRTHNWSASALHVVYQMRNQLCQLLFEEPENLLGSVQAMRGGKLLQTKGPVEGRVSPKVTHRALDRVGCTVQKLPVRHVDGPANLVHSPGMLLEKCLGNVAQLRVV